MRCGALRLNDFMEHCTCSGEWKEVVSRDDINRKLGVMRRLAEFYGLRMSGGMVEELCQSLS